MSKKITAPTIILSAFSSIVSFIASSELIQAKLKIAFTVSVGIMTTLTAMVQSFSSAYQFDIKANSHFKAADNYDQLITEIDFEKSYPNDNEFFQTLEKKVLEVKSNSQFLVPNFIKSQYYRAKERADNRDFITKNIIRPMEHDLREAIIGGNMNNYRFSDQGEIIKKELLKLKNMKELFDDDTINPKCPSDKCCNSTKNTNNINNESDLEANKQKKCCCFLNNCNKLDDTIIRNNLYDDNLA